jgi:hypothetical protein
VLESKEAFIMSNTVETEKGLIAFNILNPFDMPVEDINKKLTEAMLVLQYDFDAVNETSGLSDLNYDSETDSLKGVYAAFKDFDVKCWEKGFEVVKNLKKLEKAEFLITSKAAYIWGGSAAIKSFCEMVQNTLNIHCSTADMEQDNLEKTKEKLKKVSSVAFDNLKTDVITKASINGRINELDLSTLISEGHTINSFGGVINTPIGLSAFCINKQGKIKMQLENKNEALEPDFFDWVFDLLMRDGSPVKEPSLFDYVEGENNNEIIQA